MNFRPLAYGLILGLFVAAIAWAQTVDAIWRKVYDSSNTAIRVNNVSP